MQIIGVVFAGTGNIMALTQLWQGFFKEAKNLADFWARNLKDLQELKIGSPESRKTENDMKKIIMKHYFLERKFIYVGVTFIVIGIILQILGIVIG